MLSESRIDETLRGATRRILPPNVPAGLPWRSLALCCGVFVLSCAVLILRRPDVVLNAQFWAEDGHVWFAGVYNDGLWASLMRPYAGYFCSFSYLAMGLASLFPLEHAPLVSNLIGLAVRGLLVAFLFSSRFAWVDVRARIALTVYFLLMPGLGELHPNITNTHWYLSLYLLLIIVADEAAGPMWMAHDLFFLLLVGLSGPFIVFLAPGYAVKIAAMRGAESGRSIYRGIFFSLFWLVFSIQLLTILMVAPGSRPTMTLGANPGVLSDILASRIFAGFLMLPEHVSFFNQRDVLSVATTTMGVWALAFVFWKEDWRARCVVLFATLTLGFTLANPAISTTSPQWEVLRLDGGFASRYFVVPCVCWVAVLLYLCKRLTPAMLRLAAVAGASLIVLVSLFSFQIPPLEDLAYADRIGEFRKLPAGARMDIPLNPPGWRMTLIKK